MYATWKKVRVHIDYHVEVDGHYYSAPYTLLKQQLEARVTERTVELFLKGTRVASHARSYARGGHTTIPEHMPKAHRASAEWTPERLVRCVRETRAGSASARREGEYSRGTRRGKTARRGKCGGVR